VKVPIERVATIAVELGLNGLDTLDAICNGFGAFINQGIQDAYGTGITSNSVCVQGLRRQRRNLQAWEKPILITVTTTFPDFTTAPRQFGFVDFLEQLVVSDKAQTDLPIYLQQAIAGTNLDGDVHVTLVNSTTNNNPVLVVAFGDDAPTASPTPVVSNNTTNGGNTPAPVSTTTSSGFRNIQYLLSLLLCSALAGIGTMDIIF